MSQRLLRPRAASGATNADAKDWASRVAANSGSVSASTLAAVDQFCMAIDAAGLRDRFYRLNLFCGSNLQAVLVPLYRGTAVGALNGNATDTNTNFVSGDYVETGASGGLTGNGTNKVLDTGVTIHFSTQTDTHISAYDAGGDTGANKQLMGADTLGSPRSIYSLYQLSSSQLTYYDGTTTIPVNYVATRTAGMYQGSNQSARRDLFRNGTSVANQSSAKTGTGTGGTQTIRVFAGSQGAGVANYYAGRLCGYSIGYAMNATQAAAFYTAMQAFQTALGRQV